MNAIDKDIKELNINHYTADFKQQITAIEAFKLQYQHHASFNRFITNLDTLEADAFLKAGKFEEALVAFTELYQSGPDYTKAFNADRITTVLWSLNRKEEAVNTITREILLEKEPNYLLNLLFWYVSYIEAEQEDLIRFKPEIDKIIDRLEIITDIKLPLAEQILHLKAERIAGDRRYHGLMSGMHALSEDEKKASLTKFILDEPMGYFRKMAGKNLTEIES